MSKKDHYKNKLARVVSHWTTPRGSKWTNFEEKKIYQFIVLLYLASILAVTLVISYYLLQQQIFYVQLYSGYLFSALLMLGMLRRGVGIFCVVLLNNLSTHVVLAGLVLKSGFLNTQEVGWVLMIPLFNALQAGTRFTVQMAVVSMLMMVGLAQYTETATYSDSGRVLATDTTHELIMFGLKLAFSVAMAAIFESSRRSALKSYKISSREALKSKNLLSQTARVANIGGWSLDVQTKNVWWSEQTYHIHEVPVGERMLVRDTLRFYTQASQPLIQDALENAMENGVGWDLELPFITANGKRLWVHSVGSVVTDGQGRQHVHGTIQDITAKRQSLLEIQQTRDEAIRLATSKGRFLAMMSHEIRTPMNGVLGNIELLRTEDLAPHVKAKVENLYASSESLLNILNDILDFSKIESGKFRIEKAPFELKQLVDSITLTFMQNAKDKDLDFVVEYDPNISPHVYGDKNRIRQILTNLVSNALKFTDKGKVTVTVKSIPEDKIVCFSVRDTGPGIPKNKIATLFKMFSQLDESATRSKGGTGLGLAISKSLIDMMEGTIYVSSELGMGSTFSFELSLPECEPPKVEPAQKSVAQTYRKGLQILAIDDNQINLDVAKSLLLRLGQQCDIYKNPLEGVEQALRADYDLVLMDLHMPELDGLAATRRILEGKPDQVIIAVTASVLDEERKKCIESGMQNTLTKPLRMVALEKMFTEYFPEDS
ncbi:MAG: ATP-binding protein [Zetaproteobacteria bacterium]|nr:ATP-binding protein [Zetaproteobacteria bacterium]